ncbi:MAG: tRNA lysidine(34) synthetase TilS [Oligoflexia bacterium]|nr:tRNA lysidine(34) synthetase TilS [Oligoflexia bacterium]
MAESSPSILRALRETLPNQARLLAAVSGGRDSVCMLHALKALQEEKGFAIEVAHYDHALREASAADARFVAEYGAALGLTVHTERAAEQPDGENLEGWGRRKRYQFFERVRAERGLELILTAHTANDLAETLLIKLFANKELNTIEAFDPLRHLARPFLNVTRAEVDCYIKDCRLQFREDETNSNLELTRNRIRNQLLPELREKYSAVIDQILAEQATAVGADIKLLYQLTSAAFERCDKFEFGSKAWLRSLRAELQELAVPLRWRLAERVAQKKLGFNLGRKHSQRLVEMILEGREGLELPGGYELRAKAGGLQFVSHAAMK